MSKVIGSCVRGSTVVALGIGFLLGARANAQCLGDCNADGTVGPGELNKSIAIILNCMSNAAGCAAVPGGCTAADKNGNGKIDAGELNNIIFNILNFPPKGCPPTSPTATLTQGAAATNTPTPVPPTATPTQTQQSSAPVCGNGKVEGDEECDVGGTCIGGDNAGTHCTAEADCIGEGVCSEGIKIGTVCDNDDDCPEAKCIHCKTFGGGPEHCAANCTFETAISYDLVPGQKTKLCLGGPNNDQPCTVNANCSPALCADQVAPGTTGSFVHDGFLQLALPLTGSQTMTIGKLRDNRITAVIKTTDSSLARVPVSALACACVRSVAAKSCGGTLFEKDGTASIDCSDAFTPGASQCDGRKPCTFVHGEGNATSGIIGCGDDGLTGTELFASQVSNGQLLYQTCMGGTNDGNACSAPADCPGAPCVGGPNDGNPCTTNSDCPGGGKCGCATVPPPTPPAGSGPAMITLSGSGPKGAAIILNSSAIGTVTGVCTCTSGCLTFVKVCNGGPNDGQTCTTNADCTPGTCGKPNPAYGPDLQFCTDDDPQDSRGTPQTLPQVTGTATGIITNTRQSTQTHFCDKDRTKTCSSDANCGADGPCTFEIGPFSYTGKPYNCAMLTANPPSTEGGTVAGCFTALNQPATGDIVVRNVFVAGPRKP
jgi:hypothetical protein